MRQATSANSVKTGDLEVFKRNGQAYRQFINELTELFTEPNEKYGTIKLTKRKAGITRVNIKSGTTEVGFIYDNVSLYIIGLVVGPTFYVDETRYAEQKNKIPKEWIPVLGTGVSETVTLVELSYKNIMPRGERAQLKIGLLDKSLNKLTEIGDTNQRISIMEEHLAPFVVSFSEAIRFPVVAKLVQREIVKNKVDNEGTLYLNESIVAELSLGHPAQRGEGYIFHIYSLLLNWGNLSKAAKGVYSEYGHACINDTNYALNLCKGQLNALLGVASSLTFDRYIPPSSRSKRDLEKIYYNTVPGHQPLLEPHIGNGIDYEGNVQQSPPPNTSSPSLSGITASPDLVGALHLITVGMLYLYGRRMDMPTGNHQSYLNPREAYGIAADLADRVECFLKSAGFEMDVGFGEHMQLQRELSEALIRGQSVEQVLASFLVEQYMPEKDDVVLDKLREQLSMELANIKQGGLDGNGCFQ